MKINQILSEAELQDLLEIDRRGFLKGLGTAAVGAAAAGTAGKAKAYSYGPYPDGSGSGLNFTDEEFILITNGLELYIACKEGVITDQTICSGIKQAIGKVANLKGGRDVLNFVYPQKKSQWDQIKQMPQVYNGLIQRLKSKGRQYVDDLSAIVEF